MTKIKIKHLKPCEEALIWYNNQTNTKTAWENCQRGDWMLWIATKTKIDRQLLSLTTGYCARTVYHLLKNNDSREAICGAINYGKGLISKKELSIIHKKAIKTTTATADATYAADAANAAAGAAYAANAAADAAYAANAAANAANAAANAGFATYADAAATNTAADAAAYAAADAADAAYAAADAAAYAAADAADAAYAAADAARLKNQKQTADICRKYLTKEIYNKIEQYNH